MSSCFICLVFHFVPALPRMQPARLPEKGGAVSPNLHRDVWALEDPGNAWLIYAGNTEPI